VHITNGGIGSLIRACIFFLVLPLAAQNLPDGIFARHCESCHGENATGTDRGPTLINSRALRSRSQAQIHDIIMNGRGGMPPFKLPTDQLQALARWIRSANASAYDVQPEGDGVAGEKFFFGKGACSSCHMVRGIGATRGPDLSEVGRQMTVGEINQVLDDPAAPRVKSSIPGCPGWAYCPQSTWDVVKVKLKNGSDLRGFARNRGNHNLQLQTFDGVFHSLLEAEYTAISPEPPLMPKLQATPAERRDLIAFLSRLDGVKGPIRAQVAGDRVVTAKPGDWPSYNGEVQGNRHSPLDQINLRNVTKLQLQWTYQLPYSPLETTPLVVDGFMYVTGPNQVCALDGRTGKEVWCYSRPRNSTGIAGDAAKGANRGAAILGDRVFFATDNAHLICLNRVTGALMWDVTMPEHPGGYGATAAPLVVGDLVVSGVSGGDAPLKGFVAAYKAATGEQAWRFWTLPRPGDEAAKTWNGPDLEHGGVATWMTGSYDPATGLLYWPTGNPYPDTDGSGRKGDNLYSNCVIALDAKTGTLRWYFQFTPHDVHDWDATEPLLLVDTQYKGRPRKLLMQANRNGYFYVLDRLTGEFLLGTPFVKRLNWATGLTPKGRPIVNEASLPTPTGVVTCPAVRGATNWYATAFHPATRLFYVMATEDCSLYKTTGSIFQAARDPKNLAEKYLRALDPETGKVVWEIKQTGAPETNYSGVLTTAGGLLFYGETGGGFAAVNAQTGKPLWHFETSQHWKASPMTYMSDGRQYVAIAAGNSILSFALPQE
jgi:PQQ-dependent dehydrogenase (methanol/ethanol family)